MFCLFRGGNNKSKKIKTSSVVRGPGVVLGSGTLLTTVELDTASHYPKKWITVERFSVSVWDSREERRIQAKYSSPANQATTGNIKWVIVSWAGLFRQCVCVCVFLCKTGLFWLDFGKKAHSFLFVSRTTSVSSVIAPVAQSSSHKHVVSPTYIHIHTHKSTNSNFWHTHTHIFSCKCHSKIRNQGNSLLNHYNYLYWGKQ